MKIPNSFEFADINPLLIEYGKNKWVHPFIKEWYQPGEDGHDDNMYRIYFKNSKGEEVRIYFKSNYLTEKTNNFYGQKDWENKPKQEIFNEPFIDCDMVYTCAEMTLLEDIWCPSPPRNMPIKNSKDYAKIKASYDAEQFCFTKFGKKINSFFKNDANVNFFSLDCGLTTDGTNWWCDS